MKTDSSFVKFDRDGFPYINENDERRVVLADNGQVWLVGVSRSPDGLGHWSVRSADNHYLQGYTPVSIQELRRRAAAVRDTLVQAGLNPSDDFTSLAMAILAVGSSGHGDWFNVHDFHRGVVELTPIVMAKFEDEWTCAFREDGLRYEVGLRPSEFETEHAEDSEDK